MALLNLLMIVLSSVGVAVAFWNTLTKFRARNDLSRVLRGDDAAVKTLETLLSKGAAGRIDPDNLAAAVKLVRERAAALSPAEKREVDSALDQRSASGRASYIRGLTP
jgi:hypothetical protein